MKAITISQPYASLIAGGSKWIENRTWYTSYRGSIAIHAGKGTQYMTRKELAEVPNGCVVATAILSACVELKQIREYSSHHEHRRNLIPHTNRQWREAAEHQHAEGPWCWILENVIALPVPIPYKGAQGLWECNF